MNFHPAQRGLSYVNSPSMALAMLTAVLLVGSGGDAVAVEHAQPTPKASLDVGGRLQLVGYGERLEDGIRDDNRMYLFLRQARLMATGRMSDVTLRLEMAFGGEEEVKAPSPGVSLGLLEASADVGLLASLRLRAGQFRVPYGRERLANPATMLFVDRSITNLAFNTGRDVGVALYGTKAGMTATVGVFTGGGRSIPQRFLPQTLGTPMLVARAGWSSSGVAEDPFDMRQQATSVDSFVFAVHANALWQKDSLVGHSSVFNLKLSDRPLLLNANWNPYVGAKPTGSATVDQGTLMQIGGDILIRAPLAGGTLSAEVEVNQGTFTNVLGSVSAIGGRAQVALRIGDIEVAARYATLLSGADFKIAAVDLLAGKSIHEVTPAVSWHLNPHTKLLAELPVTMNTPTVRENGIGTYSLMAMPNQASLLRPKAPATAGGAPGPASGTLVTQSVVTGRLMLQVAF